MNDEEVNVCPNPTVEQFAQLVEQVELDAAYIARKQPNLTRAEATALAIEGACEGWELSRAVENGLRARFSLVTPNPLAINSDL